MSTIDKCNGYSLTATVANQVIDDNTKNTKGSTNSNSSTNTTNNNTRSPNPPPPSAQEAVHQDDEFSFMNSFHIIEKYT